MKFRALLLFLTVILINSCQKDETTITNTEDELSFQWNQYDNSNLGKYKAIFTTTDSQDRGTMEILVKAEKFAKATLTMSNGEVYVVKSTTKVYPDTDVTDLLFENETLSFKFSVEANGANPKITEVTFGQRESLVEVAKNTERAPVTPIAGTYVLTAGTPPPHFGMGPQTFNIMFVGAGTGNDTFTTQILVNGNNYGSSTGNSQNSCETKTTHVICQIQGSSGTVGGNPITYSGNHVYRNGTPNCSLVYGKWTYTSATYGVSSGTFLNDNPCPIPANDLCNNATPIACGGTATGSTITSTTFGNPSGQCDESTDTTPSIVGSVWFKYTSSGLGKNITASLCPSGTTGTSYDSKISVYTGTCGADNLVCLGGNDDFCNLVSQFTFTEDTSGTTVYYIRVYGYDDEAGAFKLTLTCATPPPPPPANNVCTGAFAIACGGTATGDIANYTNNYSGRPGRDAFYIYNNVGAARAVTVATCGSSYDTVLYVLAANCTTVIAQNDDSALCGTGSAQSKLTFNAAANTSYRIVVDAYFASTTTGTFNLSVTCGAAPIPNPEIFSIESAPANKEQMMIQQELKAARELETLKKNQ